MKFEDWCEATKRDEERAFERKRPWPIAGEILGGILLTMLYPLLFWLFLVATPPQSSAINDLEEDCPNAVRTSNLEDAP